MTIIYENITPVELSDYAAEYIDIYVDIRKKMDPYPLLRTLLWAIIDNISNVSRNIILLARY